MKLGKYEIIIEVGPDNGEKFFTKKADGCSISFYTFYPVAIILGCMVAWFMYYY